MRNVENENETIKNTKPLQFEAKKIMKHQSPMVKQNVTKKGCKYSH